MSRLFGPIFQNGYMVDDLNRAVEHWTRLGVGPFFRFPLPIDFTHLEYCGERLEGNDLCTAVALGYSGELQVELIVPGTLPSPYHAFLERGLRGLQHVGARVEDMDAALKTAGEAGLQVVMQGAMPGFRFAYLDDGRDEPGAMLELIEQGPEAQAMFAMMKAASVGWDGRDPLRNV